jgi:hypothetical protein
VQQWHAAKGTSSGNLGPKEIVDREKKLPQPERRLHAVQDIGIWKETKTMSHQEARKKGCSGRDCGKARNATLV